VVAPLLVSASGFSFAGGVPSQRLLYYFWFFGYVAKLPYEQESQLPTYGGGWDLPYPWDGVVHETQ